MNTIPIKKAIAEITRLRHENEIMRARLQMFDDIMKLFNNKPGGAINEYTIPSTLQDLEILLSELENKKED